MGSVHKPILCFGGAGNWVNYYQLFQGPGLYIFFLNGQIIFLGKIKTKEDTKSGIFFPKFVKKKYTYFFPS